MNGGSVKIKKIERVSKKCQNYLLQYIGWSFEGLLWKHRITAIIYF